MAGPVPHVVSFGGGIVKEGAPDTQRTDEVKSCDGYDIGPRGALIAARDRSDYVAINDLGTVPAPWVAMHGLRSVAGNNFTKQVAIGEGLSTATLRYLMASFLRTGETSPIDGSTAVRVFGAPQELGVNGSIPTPRPEGVLVTVAPFPGVYDVRHPGEAASKINVFLVNLGAREGFAADVAPGLYVVYATPANTLTSTELDVLAISRFDALGTGERGEYKIATDAAGTKARQLYFRGVAAYNAHAFAWGHDAQGTNKDGPARLMFSNAASPLKWGNDNVAAASTDRVFTDTDAIPVGDGGELIRGGLAWGGRFWIGTDRQLHYVAGYGRDSFIADGSNAVAKAENTLGPHCLIEGPDKLLYGVGDQGLWAFDGSTFDRHHKRLRDFANNSLGFWDLIWVDRTRADTHPGKTNADLVWMVSDWDAEQVVVGIPWCDASSGRGYGTDTVLIKYNVRTGGFTRQAFSGVVFTAADYVRRQRQHSTVRFLGTPTSGEPTVQKYGDRESTEGYLPTPLPDVEAGPYALYGPNGAGVYRKAYLTIAWEPDIGIATIASLSDEADETIAVNVAIVSTPVGSEVIEVWSYNAVDDAWVLETSAAWLGGGSQTIVCGGLRPGIAHTLAARLSRGGSVHSTYSDASPDNWPAAARASSATTLATAPTFELDSWDPNTGAIIGSLVPPGTYLQSHMDAFLEWQPSGGGSWTALTTTYNNVNGAISATDAGLIGTFPTFRAKQTTATPLTSPASNEIGTDVSVADPTSVLMDPGGATPGFYLMTWSMGEAGVTTLISVQTTDAGTWGAETEIGEDIETGEAAGVCPTGFTPIKGRARHKRNIFGIDYFSSYVESSNDIATNC